MQTPLQETATWLNQRLTARELQVMKLVIQGLPSKSIAAKLGISQRTVDAHRGSMYSKLNVRGAMELAHLVFTRGMRSRYSLAEPDADAYNGSGQTQTSSLIERDYIAEQDDHPVR
ncbi:response regulator transcription factor [Paenalcaligenes sp. Me131]|uniref:response regulator transcription factor n=1 Tax=Paenalcaligenes sp. Me131 TaxID=3392636 RepID=UPI003D2AD611